MKTRIIIIFTVLAFGYSFAFAQDSSQNSKHLNDHTYRVHSKKMKHKSSVKHGVYRDTRLGGSSPNFNTYRKNDYGAGAITTDPTKTNGTTSNSTVSSDSSNNLSPVLRDTRSGGSSPHHRSYKTNDYGAGAITTDPNKGDPHASSTPTVVTQVTDSTKK